MALPPPPSIRVPPSTKTPKRPPGPASGNYVAGRLLAGSGQAWKPYYALIEKQAKSILGSARWAPWLLAQLMFENPNGPSGNAQAVNRMATEVGVDIKQAHGSVPDGANSILAGATGGALPPLPPALAVPGAVAPGKPQRQAKTALYNAWATVKNGKLVPSTDPTPPKDTVKLNGVPITVSMFNNYSKSINNVYIAYTGRQGSAQQIANVLNHGINIQYTLTKQLALTKAFRNSPFWKAHVDAYIASWQKIYGNNSKPDMGAIQRAMANQVDSGSFAVEIRQRPDYVKSEEYLSNSAQMMKQYEAIYGKADQNGLALIHQATLAGWDPDQFATYLRKQPGYTKSPEYQTKLIAFLGALGMVTGGEPTLNAAGPAPGNKLTSGAPPPDSRVAAPLAAPQPLGPLQYVTPGDSGGPPTPFGGANG